MKTRHLLFAGLLGILSAATAGAQQKIFISGAPAVRSYVSKAINDVLTSASGATITYAYSGSGVTSATAFANSNALTFYGGSVTVNGSSVPITVEVSYVGSSSGIQDVASTGTANFLPAGATPGSSPYADPTTAGNPGDAEYPLFTASDEFQQSTPWYGTNTLTVSGTVTYQPLDADIAGVIPYRFVASPDAPSRLTNITPQQAQELWRTGYIWLSSLTGSTSANSGGAAPDDTEAIYALGRNPGSGLRTVLLSETGIGVQTDIKQFEPSITSTNGAYVATGQVPYVTGTVNGVYINKAGDNGYSSFGSLDPAISAHTSGTYSGVVAVATGTNHTNYPAIGATKAIYLTALADADALTAIGNGAHELSYNGFYAAGAPYNPTVTGSSVGVFPSGGGASPALANGQYTFWSYIQLQYQDGLTTASLTVPNTTTLQQQAAYAFEQALYQELKSTDAAVLLQNMNVYRDEPDGSNIYQGSGGY